MGVEYYVYVLKKKKIHFLMAFHALKSILRGSQSSRLFVRGST
jgi:hypothetical protein